jgi:hypothetical protein
MHSHQQPTQAGTLWVGIELNERVAHIDVWPWSRIAVLLAG